MQTFRLADIFKKTIHLLKMVAESIKLQSFLRFQEQLRVQKDGNSNKELSGIVYIYTTCTRNGSQGSG